MSIHLRIFSGAGGVSTTFHLCMGGWTYLIEINNDEKGNKNEYTDSNFV